MRDIDFRRPAKFPREHVRRLEAAHEGFCRSASSRLSAELRRGVELTVAGSEQLPYAVAMDEVPRHALLALLRLDPHDTRVALILEMPLALCLVDCLLGGGVTPRTELPEDLTDVEVAVARRAVRSIVEPLSASWQDLVEASLSIVGTETSPVNVQIVPPSEPTLLLRIQVRVDDLVSPMTLCLPYRAIEPVLGGLELAHYGQVLTDDSTTAAVRAAVSDVDVELRAEVGAVELSLERVLALREGDVVRLNRRAAGGVVLHADEVPAHVAMPGTNGNRRAVQIVRPSTR